jgi:uncharacterized protein YecT (DUF1311 family)
MEEQTMKTKFYVIIMSIIMAALILGCSKQVPKCSDDDTITLARKIIFDQIGGSEGLTDKEIQENMKFALPRATGHDEKIKKYSCEAKLIAGNTIELPISYASQLDDQGQHIVSVGGISRGDLFVVLSAIKESLIKTRSPKSEAIPEPAKATPSASTAPTPPEENAAQHSQSSSVEQSGLCKGLDLSITAEQIDCLERKYSAADKELNDIYKQTMSKLDGSRRTALKKEQIAWIKEKETKCAQAGKEMEGGTLETVMIKDCFVQMTEQRVTYLKNFK